MHHPFSVMTRTFGVQATYVQVQVWTRLGLLATMKIHNFVHLLLPYRVTEACATPHSRPPPVIPHSSRFRTGPLYLWVGIEPRSLSLEGTKAAAIYFGRVVSVTFDSTNIVVGFKV
jgi:hypothetical protein